MKGGTCIRLLSFYHCNLFFAFPILQIFQLEMVQIAKCLENTFISKNSEINDIQLCLMALPHYVYILSCFCRSLRSHQCGDYYFLFFFFSFLKKHREDGNVNQTLLKSGTRQRILVWLSSLAGFFILYQLEI